MSQVPVNIEDVHKVIGEHVLVIYQLRVELQRLTNENARLQAEVTRLQPSQPS